MSKLKKLNLPYEETYLGFDIYIETNPDEYREGFCWSISRNDEEHDYGLDFEAQQALEAAYKAIEKLTS
ncbi:hypothetical protein [Shewanella sp. 10N.286.52.B9]|uniref:hypothetical protein n=1 Tax=Shewanella sp. 10N.286.52.B9 TaxID=1880837 RepID=UPI000C8492D8|nr:hypothetical protein [Shewanella sp. 10N.286.52.B9]PMG51367.1 hypothetical protein BCU91_16570 [Shewanella sp. 10N.286.52.B9]